MQEKIFDSLITLKLANGEIQDKFNEEKNQTIKKVSKIYFYIILILSVAGLILNFFSSINNKGRHKDWQQSVELSSVICTIISASIVTLRTLSENKRLIKILNYLSYILLLFVMINLRFYFDCRYMSLPVSFCAGAAAELSFRIFWKINFYLSFLEVTVLNALLFISMSVCYAVDGLINAEIVFVYLLVQIKITLLMYHLDKSEREMFHLYRMANIRNQRLSSVLENMNTGYLSLKSGSISYINNYLCRRLITVNNISCRWMSQVVNPGQNNKDLKEYFMNNSSYFIKELFSNIEANPNNQRVVDMLQKIEYLIKHWKESDRNFILKFVDLADVEPCDGYVFIGDKNFFDHANPDNFLSFEIYFRKIGEAELEVLFNDVSRSRMNEQKSAEIKYRTLFLSKVVHEFKNPLLSINELVDQTSEFISQISSSEEKHVSEIFNQIKALSNYLLILVKDLDFFSQLQMNKKISLDKQKGSLDDTIDFIKNIIETLLKKHGKHYLVSFKVIKEDFVPDHIYTDHTRLKQVLLNLISNSIKFTNAGYILLKICFEKIDGGNYIKFIIQDTGIGMKEEQLKNIFQPYNKGREMNNESGAGLGLTIVRDLTNMLGKQIQFKSKEGEGSTFWFSVFCESCDSPRLEYRKDEKPKSGKNGDLIDILSSRFATGGSESIQRQTMPQIIQSNIHGVISDLSRSKNAYNIIIVDDEAITRQSMARLITQAARDLKAVVNIIQADDGIECLYIVYKSIRLGVKITLIFSDQNMHFLSGSESAEEIHKITRKAHINIPFYLVTAYEDRNMLNRFRTDYVTEVKTKPLNKNQMKLILSNVL
jgi:signal transduction histidine kinase/CheY-like chemotaxis protein